MLICWNVLCIWTTIYMEKRIVAFKIRNEFILFSQQQESSVKLTFSKNRFCKKQFWIVWHSFNMETECFSKWRILEVKKN